MATNILKIGLLIIAAQFLLSSGCNKNGTSCLSSNITYSFSAPAEWIPQRATYNTGDTIFLVSDFPKTLRDLVNPSLIIDYSNFVGVTGDIRISVVDTTARQVLPAKDSFDFVSVIGYFSERAHNQNQGINFNYSEGVSKYEFKGALICRRKGIYGIGVSDLVSGGIRGKNCTKAGFQMTITNTDKHLTLYETALGITLDADAIRRGYSFRVQ